MLLEVVKGKFPGIPASFPAYRPKSADFGQNLQNSGLRAKKFAAKLPAAGNCTQRRWGQKSTFVCAREARGADLRITPKPRPRRQVMVRLKKDQRVVQRLSAIPPKVLRRLRCAGYGLLR